MKKRKVKKIVFILPIIIFIIVLLICLFIKNNNGDIVNNKSYCNEYSIYGNVLYNKDKSSYIIENITYCKNYDISKYREINATLFEKNENTINEITSYEYKEESSILLDKFLGGKTFKGDYSKGI